MSIAVRDVQHAAIRGDGHIPRLGEAASWLGEVVTTVVAKIIWRILRPS